MATQQQQQQPIEQQWQPSYTAEQTRRLVKTHSQSPSSFNEETLNVLRQHTQYHNIPFYEGDFSIIDALKQAGGGLIEGFTTLNIVKEVPDNTYEAIARNIGHLVGFAPSILASPFRKLSMITGSKSAAALSNIAAEAGKWSVPMATANWATRKAKKVAGSALIGGMGSRHKAVNSALSFLAGNKARHITEGAFHLGVASAVSNVWHGVDSMMSSAFHGAIAGGVFRSIGNLVQTGNPDADKWVRTLSGSLFMGLNSEMRGATTPEKIYDYLLGAYFGGKEMSWKQAKIQKLANEVITKGKKDALVDLTSDPELAIENFKEYPEDIRTGVIDLLNKRNKGTPN